MKTIFFLFLMCFNLYSYACCIGAHDNVAKQLNEDGYVYEVKGPLTIDAIEEDRTILIEVDGVAKQIPFGLLHDQWKKMKSQLMPDDCIFYVISNEESWKHLAGREGYILYRNGEIIFSITTKIS